MTSSRTRLIAVVTTAVLAATVLTGADLARAASPPTVPVTAEQLADLSQRYGVTGAADADLDLAAVDPAAQNDTPTTATEQAAAQPTIGKAGTIESARGIGATAMLGGTGGSWVHIHPNGYVARVSASGQTEWSRGVLQLEKDWGLANQNWYQPNPYVTTMQFGFNPFGPLASVSTHPYAITDVTGDGVDDLIVPFGVGFSPYRPLTIPGSQLKVATLLSVMDGANGAIVYKRVFPGYVTGMLAFGRTVVVANMTGPSWNDNPVAEQGDSRSSLTALAFSTGTAPTANVAWQFNPNVPWARWNLLEPAGSGRIAAAWTDTPLGLGSPRPAAAHLLMLDAATGAVGWNVETAGYPRLAVYDAARDALVVAEQNDLTEDMRWDLARFTAGGGSRTLVKRYAASAPVALSLDARPKPDYLVAALSATFANNGVSVSGSTLRRVDSATGADTWSYALAADAVTMYPEVMGMFVSDQANTIVATVADPVATRVSTPDGPSRTRLIALNRSNGELRWQRSGGPVASALQLTQVDSAGLLTIAADQTAYVYQIADGTIRQTVPTLGEVNAAVAADVNGDGRKDLIVGGLSRGVFAYDGKTLGSGQTYLGQARELWHTSTAGSVHQLSLATVDGTSSVVVAATSEVAVLDLHGAVRTRRSLPGYVFDATPADLDGDGNAEILVPTTELVALNGSDLSNRWSYHDPSGTAYFSVPAVDGDGHVAVLSSGPATWPGLPAVAPAATGLDGRTGAVVWHTASASSDVRGVFLTNGAYYSPDVPGTRGHSVALAFSAGFDKGTVIEVRDIRSGALVAGIRAGGPFSHNGFVATPVNGLVELSPAGFRSIHPDLTTDEHYSIPDTYQLMALTGPEGRPLFATASNGPVLWDAQAVYNGPTYGPILANVADVISAKGGFAADLDGDGVDELVMHTGDPLSVRLNRQVAGSDVLDSDNALRGVTVFDLDGDGALAGGSATAAAAATTGTAHVELNAPNTLFRFGTDLPAKAKAPDLGVGHDLVEGEAEPAGVGATAIPGYTPTQVRAHLGLTGDGDGQTVGVVIAYDVPRAESDLAVFSQQFGLPECSTANGCFTKAYADGTPDATTSTSWQVEAMLDLEWVHAIAPKAKLKLVLAKNASAAAMWHAVDVAAAGGSAVVNNSWGMGEFSGQGFYSDHCKLAAAVCTFSTGDAGYPAGYGSTSPYALAVGGTSLRLDADGTVLSESAWRATGGGASFFTPRPAFQNGVHELAYRGTPDVSEVADPLTGVAVYSSPTGTGRWSRVGGTSLSAPIWSGILAVAAGLRAQAGKASLAAADGSVFTAVYGLTGLNDVTSGGNGACGTQCIAGPGYDFVTGRGTPRSGIDQELAAMP